MAVEASFPNGVKCWSFQLCSIDVFLIVNKYKASHVKKS